MKLGLGNLTGLGVRDPDVVVRPERRLDKAAHSTVGVYVSNLFNNVHDTTPCKSDGTGCYPFNGPLSGVTSAPGAWIYQDYTQNPRRVEFFLTLRK